MNIKIMLFVTALGILAILILSLRIKENESDLEKDFRPLKTSTDSTEFMTWLREKEELNQQVRRVCRETDQKSLNNIGRMSFMYVESANLLFCLNQKVTLNNFQHEFDQFDLKSRWEPQPGYLTSFSFQVWMDSIVIVRYINPALHTLYTITGTNVADIGFKNAEDYSHRIHGYCE